MIWTDPATGRRWNVQELGHINSPILTGSDDAPHRTLPEGVVVLGFLSIDGPRESRVVSGAPDDWQRRPEVIGELFAEAGRAHDDEDDV